MRLSLRPYHYCLYWQHLSCRWPMARPLPRSCMALALHNPPSYIGYQRRSIIWGMIPCRGHAVPPHSKSMRKFGILERPPHELRGVLSIGLNRSKTSSSPHTSWLRKCHREIQDEICLEDAGLYASLLAIADRCANQLFGRASKHSATLSVIRVNRFGMEVNAA